MCVGWWISHRRFSHIRCSNGRKPVNENVYSYYQIISKLMVDTTNLLLYYICLRWNVDIAHTECIVFVRKCSGSPHWPNMPMRRNICGCCFHLIHSFQCNRQLPSTPINAHKNVSNIIAAYWCNKYSSSSQHRDDPVSLRPLLAHIYNLSEWGGYNSRDSAISALQCIEYIEYMQMGNPCIMHAQYNIGCNLLFKCFCDVDHFPSNNSFSVPVNPISWHNVLFLTPPTAHEYIHCIAEHEEKDMK